MTAPPHIPASIRPKGYYIEACIEPKDNVSAQLLHFRAMSCCLNLPETEYKNNHEYCFIAYEKHVTMINNYHLFINIEKEKLEKKKRFVNLCPF